VSSAWWPAFATAGTIINYTPPAGAPPTGADCQTSDGKIDGRGSTLQEEPQQQLLSKSFTAQACSKEVPVQAPGDPAERTMVAYNYLAAKEHSATGSGAGLQAMGCRTDDFAASDIPYSQGELVKTLDGLPLAPGECEVATGFETPFTPFGPWPSAEDHEARMMAFPIGGSSAAILVHLTSVSCGGVEPPSTFEFTPTELSRIFGGDALTWNDEELVKNNPGLSVCTAAIARIVDQNNSGTGSVLKSMFANAEERPEGAAEPKEKGIVLNNREGSPEEAGKHTFQCAPGHRWKSFLSPNTNWPSESEGGVCSRTGGSARSGDAEEIHVLSEVTGGIGFANLPQAISIGVEIDHMAIATVRNATGNAYAKPNNGKAPNCSNFAATASLPGVNAEEAVGLNAVDDWSYNNREENGKPNHGNVTLKGDRYPICSLTWDMVYTHMASSTDPEVAIKRLTPDQRMTEFDYFSWILNEGTQKELAKDDYAPLPESWLEFLRPGFEANF
jgi:ABC-type phosphate transport system substrate-binding protein